MSDRSFRRSTDADWPAIWRIFSTVVGAGDTYTYAPDISEQDARDTWLAGPGEARTTFVAIVDDQVVGTALLKPNLLGGGDHVANAGWMIDPAHAGQGIGREFAIYVIDEARALGFTGMQFNAVVASNQRAVRLWQSLGFETIGTVPGAFRHPTDGRVGLHIMYRDL